MNKFKFIKKNHLIFFSQKDITNQINKMRSLTSTITRKQNVFVPQYEGRPVFEEYQGIPADEYMEKAKESLDNFVRDSNGGTMFIETMKGGHQRKYAWEVKAQLEDGELKISASNQEFKINPTKWGFDTVLNKNGKEQQRFWLFDGNTLNDFNVILTK